jgi:hypothetical protein
MKKVTSRTESKMAEKVTKRTHTYHAVAQSLGGSLILPVNQSIPSQANASLHGGGGISHDVQGAFHHEKIVSAGGTYSHVVGCESKKSGGWATLATSVVEDLNIQEIVTADRVVARLSIEHPAVGYTPKVTLVGSNFINLRIAGFPVQAVLNSSLLNPADDYPKTTWLENPKFLDAARQQHRRRAKGSPHTKELEERYGWIGSKEGIDQRGYVVCSLVDSIVGDFPGTASGNMVDIPEVGKFFFGEFTVDRNSFRLTMIRAELGCPIHGTMMMADAVGTGTSYP